MEEPLLKSVILGEIEGKNAAIHAYDRMIWTVRSGFLTLFFGAWGLLMKSLLGVTVVKQLHYAVVGAMWLLSVSIASAAFAIDVNYLRRKFRVIASLNHLIREVAEYGEQLVDGASDASRALVESLQIVGDSASTSYQGRGYRGAMTVGLLIYVVPLVALTVGLILIWAWR
jgi:hypothetical protein